VKERKVPWRVEPPLEPKAGTSSSKKIISGAVSGLEGSPHPELSVKKKGGSFDT